MAILDDVTAIARQSSQQSVAQQQAGAVAASQQLATEHDADGFAARIAAQRQTARADASAVVDRAYDDATQIGQAHPDQQDAILAGMNELNIALQAVQSALQAALDTVAAAAAAIIAGTTTPDRVVDDFAPARTAVAAL